MFCNIILLDQNWYYRLPSILASSFTIAFLLHYLIRRFGRHHGRDPPSPPGLPIIGHLHLIGSSFPKSFQALACRYGPLIRVRLGSEAYLVASSSAVAEEILKTNDACFLSKFETGPTHFNIYRGTGFITGPHGDYWRFMRKLCVTRLFGGAQFDRFNTIREQELAKLVKSLMKWSEEGRACDLNVELETLANNVVCKMMMRRRFLLSDRRCKEMRRMVSEIMDIAGKFGVNGLFGVLRKVDLFGYGRKLQEALWRYDDVLEEIMKDYEENSFGSSRTSGVEAEGDKDVMDILLETYRDENAQVKLTRKQIKHFIIELLMASIDTSAATLQWAMAELINRPNIFKKLREEIDSITGVDRLVKESDVQNLPYLRALVKESLRLHTAAPMIPRECSQDCKINGFNVKSKTRVLINAYAIMRDPDMWEDPDKFMPERFLLGGDDGHDFRFLPFGGGRRGCIGYTHVYMIMHTTMAALVQCFDWKVKDGEHVDISVALGFTGAMTPPLLCYPTARFHPF
ncbi:unnamed protein product [Linum tenue]|uniref:Cytochrome P450 n=4 Tax=Linum tenue TaxID=586396 RepID=A0AAV0ML76_9ROSI|nr:unnamed protein product [Linum tenue]